MHYQPIACQVVLAEASDNCLVAPFYPASRDNQSNGWCDLRRAVGRFTLRVRDLRPHSPLLENVGTGRQQLERERDELSKANRLYAHTLDDKSPDRHSIAFAEACGTIGGMLIPQFSLRWLLAIVTASSFVFLILSLGTRGYAWAVGASIGLLSIAVILLMHGFCFFLVWCFARLRKGQSDDATLKSLVFLLGIFIAATSSAGTLSLQLPPINPTTFKQGVQLTVESQWVQGPGYRPFTLTLRCPQPYADDRTFSIEIRSTNWNPNHSLFATHVDVELPAGTSIVTKTIAVPDFVTYNNYSINTWEDGRFRQDLSKEQFSNGWNSRDQSAPQLLFVSATAPDITQLNLLFPQSQYNQSQPPIGAAIPQDWQWLPAASLPDDWICYQSVDLAFISLTDLQSLKQSSPMKLIALAKWVRAEGTLVVFGVGNAPHKRAELDVLFELAPDLKTANNSGDWRLPVAEHYSDEFIDLQQAMGTAAVPELDEHGNPRVKPAKSPPAGDPPFQFRLVQQGMVIAIAKDDPFGTSLDLDTWHWIFNTIGVNRWMGARRTGINTSSENSDFWTFTIPGVGGAPVDTYRVLITAFVVAIGPLNYWWLRKRNRLHLLLFTAPASAILVTAALLGYAILADGFHTRTRSRSATLLDQRTGNAITWARLAYYSGLAPSSGLTFSEDTAVIPYDFLPYESGNRMTRTTKLGNGKRHLEQGWLSSRTPTQLMTERPYQTQIAIDVDDSAGEGIAITNRLGRQIHHLLVRDRHGRFGYGAQIADGGRTILTSITGDTSGSAVDAADSPMLAMEKAFQANVLSFPEGFTHEPQSNIFGIRSYVHYMSRNGVFDASQSTGRLETAIELAKVAVKQAGIPGNSLALAPCSYIAILDRPDEVPLGLEETTELQGFHLLRGNW